MPEAHDLDPGEIEIIVDLDLDEIQAPLTEEVAAGANASGYLQPWNRLRQSLMRRLVNEGHERTSETVQALLRLA